MIIRNLSFLVILTLSAILFSFQSLALAQSSPIDTTLASQYFQEANALCSRDDGKLWGVSLCAPMLFVDRKTRTIVANFADKEGILTKDGNVFVGQLPAKVNIANTATEWAGVKWTMVIFPSNPPQNNSMDVRAKQRLCYLACLFTFGGLGGSFAPRHLSRCAASNGLRLIFNYAL